MLGIFNSASENGGSLEELVCNFRLSSAKGIRYLIKITIYCTS